MAIIKTEKTLIYGTSERDIIEVLNASARVSAYGGDGDDTIEQPTANSNVNLFFDGGNGFDTLNLIWISNVVDLSFTAEWKLIGKSFGIELKVSGNNGVDYAYNVTFVNGEGVSLFFSEPETDYSLLENYFPIYGINGPTAISPVFSDYVSRADDNISVRSIYWGVQQHFGAGRDVITFFTYGTIADLGAGDDMACINDSAFGFVDGGAGNDTYVVGKYGALADLKALDGTYSLDTKGWLNISFPGLFNNSLYLKNFEQIVFADRIVGIVTAKLDNFGKFKNELLSGQSTRSSIVVGGTGNDTIRGVFGGDALAGGQGDDLITAAYSLSNATLGQNKINNGSFEFNATLPGRWAYKNNIVGWDSLRFDGRNWVRGGQMEVWNNFFMQKASDGTSLIEIDANDRYNGIGQTVRGLTKDIQYQLSFDLTARERTNAETLDVYWNNRKLGEFKAVSRGGWTTYTTIVTASGNAAGDLLRFLELAGENNGRGVLLDNVKLQQITLSNTPNRLDGGTGRDTLVGSIGADVFVFDIGDTGTTRTAADVIRQFTSGQDVVDIAKITEGRELQFGGNAFSPDDYEPEIITQNVTGGVLALIDSDGDNRANAALFFEGVSRLAARDFKFA